MRGANHRPLADQTQVLSRQASIRVGAEISVSDRTSLARVVEGDERGLDDQIAAPGPAGDRLPPSAPSQSKLATAPY